MAGLQSEIETGTPQPDQLAAVKPGRFWFPVYWPHLLVLAIYTLLTGFYLAPLLEHFWQNVPFGGDSWIFYWDLWWVKKSVLELHTNPFFTGYVNFPGGASLHYHTLAFLDGLLAIPLQGLGMSLAGAFNSLVLFGYIFSAYGAFCLADYIVKNKAAAFVAGLIFGFSPFHFAHLVGQLNFVSIQWFPFYVLFLLKALDPPPGDRSRIIWLNTGLASLFLALNALTEWTLAAFLVMLSGLYILYRLWIGRREWRAVLRGPVLRLALMLIFFGLLTSPVLLPMLVEAGSNKNIKFDPQESVYYSADLLSFVTPYELHPLLGKYSQVQAAKFTGNPTERTTYLGIIALLLATTGSLVYRKRGAAFWSLSALTFVILALGPQLQASGRVVFTVFKLTIPLPYAFLYRLPFFSIMRTPARFSLVAVLAVTVLAAFGMKALLNGLEGRFSRPVEGTNSPARAGKWAGWGVITLVSLLIAVEFAPYVTTAYPNVPPIYDPIRQDPDATKAVLELPLRPASHFYIAQVAYQKPMVGGYLARQVGNPLVEEIPALKTLALRSAVPSGDAAQLQTANIRYVVVNWWMLNETETRQMQAALQQVFGRPPDAQEMEPDNSKLRISLFILK